MSPVPSSRSRLAALARAGTLTAVAVASSGAMMTAPAAAAGADSAPVPRAPGQVTVTEGAYTDESGKVHAPSEHSYTPGGAAECEYVANYYEHGDLSIANNTSHPVTLRTERTEADATKVSCDTSVNDPVVIAPGATQKIPKSGGSPSTIAYSLAVPAGL